MESRSQTEEMAVVLARRLKAARLLSGQRVPELARGLGWSPQKLYRLEAGAQVPDAIELAQLASATRQSVTFFLGETSGGGDGVPVQPSLPGPLPLGQVEDVEGVA